MKDHRYALSFALVGLAGVLLGAQASAAPAQAQTAGVQYARCAVVRQESLDVGSDGHAETMDTGHTILIPAGWEVVGGGGQGGGDSGTYLGAIVLCHR